MRTKTLLIVAASALAAAVTSSQAQSTVYSQNIVGYVNQTLTPGSYELVAPALDVDGSGTNGTISTVVGTNIVSGTTVLVWNGAGYDTLAWGSPGRGQAATWTLEGTTPTADPTYPLNVGEGFFINDPTDTNMLQTGVVMQGTLVNPYVRPAGTYSLVSSIVPIAGDITTNLNYQPSSGDTILTWTGSGFNTYAYGSPGRGQPAVWTLEGTTPVQQDPVLSVGQGFFLNPAVNNTWTEVFTNN